MMMANANSINYSGGGGGGVPPQTATPPSRIGGDRNVDFKERFRGRTNFVTKSGVIDSQEILPSRNQMVSFAVASEAADRKSSAGGLSVNTFVPGTQFHFNMRKSTQEIGLKKNLVGH